MSILALLLQLRFAWKRFLHRFKNFSTFAKESYKTADKRELIFYFLINIMVGAQTMRKIKKGTNVPSF